MKQLTKDDLSVLDTLSRLYSTLHNTLGVMGFSMNHSSYTTPSTCHCKSNIENTKLAILKRIESIVNG